MRGYQVKRVSSKETLLPVVTNPVFRRRPVYVWVMCILEIRPGEQIFTQRASIEGNTGGQGCFDVSSTQIGERQEM